MRRFVLLAMVAGMALTTLARPAMAATKTPYTSVLTITGEIDPGITWVSDGVGHTRGQVLEGVLTDDLAGTAIVVFNGDYPCCGGGIQWGTFVFTTEDVTYEGTFHNTIQNPPGFIEAQGSDGSKLAQSTYTWLGGSDYLLEGVILDP